jgi:Carboxymuconolactone decarboxylase family
LVARIDPVCPPYPPEVAERLDAMMPSSAPPILLFRIFVRNLPMASAMGGWGSYELSKRLSLPMRDREIIIDRTCARCRCEYEWGVHVAFFAGRAGLSDQQITSLTHGAASDPCCFTANGARVTCEDGAPRFADMQSVPSR